VTFIKGLSVFNLLPENQITQPLTVTVGQVQVQRMYLLLSSELDNGHCYALLPVENKRLCTFD
jgi:hypothetical protein